MSFPMIFCAWDEAKDFGFHQAIMDDTAWIALLAAFVIGAVVAVLYYCIVGKSASMSNLVTWLVALVVALGVDYVVSDTVFIGKPINPKEGVTKESLSYEYSAFKAIDSHAKDLLKTKKYQNNTELKEKMNKCKVELTKKLDKGKDIRLAYDLSCLFWTLVFFVLASYASKNFTEQAQAIPTYWPAKSK